MRLNLETVRSITCGAEEVFEKDGGIWFYRFTSPEFLAYDRLGNPPRYKRLFTTAGVRLAFRTSSTSLSFSYELSPGSTPEVNLQFFDLYIDGALSRHFGTESMDDKSGRVEIQLGEGYKDVELNFPWSANAVLFDITVDDGAEIIPLKRKKTMIAYGDSITHGYSVRYPSLSYAMQLARMLDADIVNKGIGGDTFGEGILAEANDSPEMESLAIPATYVGGSQYYDLAVLSISRSDIVKNSFCEAVALAAEEDAIVGQSAIAIGNPENGGIAASSGIVSVDSEYIRMTTADGKEEISMRVMRIDTAVNSGNSGGGLFNSKGELIGIVNAKLVDDSVENIGYAIPLSVVRSVADNIVDHCLNSENERVQRAMLGITVTTTDSRAVYDTQSGLVTVNETVTVYEVSENGLGSMLKVGDIFVSISVGDVQRTITRQHHVIDFMLNVRVGDTLTVTVLRDGVETQCTAVITEACVMAY